jgi:GTPase SAR1 family protein
MMEDHPSKYVPSSTVGIDHTTIQFKSGTVTIWDFAGQIEYTVTHQFFLSSEV